ncbi:oxidation resistance protein 1 [Savitreella phatthalungensis]
MSSTPSGGDVGGGGLSFFGGRIVKPRRKIYGAGTSHNPAFLQPPSPQDLVLHTPIADPHRTALTVEVAKEIRSLLPTRLQLASEWECIYALDAHGVSLRTLYGRCEEAARKARAGMQRPGYVVVVRDVDGVAAGEPVEVVEEKTTEKRKEVRHGVFGAFLNEHPRPHAGYFGNGECFLWRTDRIGETGGDLRFKAFPWTGLNDYQCYCTPEFLSLGGGDEGRYALWLDESLSRGISSTTTTFGNEPLTGETCSGGPAGSPFGVLAVEVWLI